MAKQKRYGPEYAGAFFVLLFAGARGGAKSLLMSPVALICSSVFTLNPSTSDYANIHMQVECTTLVSKEVSERHRIVTVFVTTMFLPERTSSLSLSLSLPPCICIDASPCSWSSQWPGPAIWANLHAVLAIATSRRVPHSFLACAAFLPWLSPWNLLCILQRVLPSIVHISAFISFHL